MLQCFDSEGDQLHVNEVLDNITWAWEDQQWWAITRAAAMQAEERRDRCG